MDLIATMKAARRVSTPLLAIGTADQHAVIATICEATASGEHPQVRWDCVRGLKGLNDPGAVAVAALPKDQVEYSQAPASALGLAEKLPKFTILFMMNAHRFLSDPTVVQAVSNLRDVYKEDRRTLVMLAPGYTFPAELVNDVVELEEPLPSDEAIKSIVRKLYSDAKIESKWDDDLADHVVDAARGLSAFAVEQVVAMSLSKAGVNLDDCWQRKRAAVNQVRGLTLSRGGPTFSDIGGLESIKEYGRLLLAGGAPPRAIVRLDEIEKMLAGAAGDNTGVSQDALSAWLKWMEDGGHDGLIAVGLPGGGKSLFSKALGSTYDVPTIEVDLGAMKASHVGESEANARAALRAIEAVAGNRAFVVATCNKLDVMPPELRRRFKSGTWFFDLPTSEEKDPIWKINLAHYSVAKPGRRPDDNNWTGAEIRNCCEIAWRLNCSLKDAARYIVPVAIADPIGLDKLRESATGRFLSASYPGPYTKEKERIGRTTGTSAGRMMEMGE
jgi:hypothetical protein